MKRLTFQTRGGAMAAVAFGAGEPDALFLHANGFNGLMYRIVLEPMADRLPSIALDLRGHGRTQLPTPFLYDSWRLHVRDVIDLLDRTLKRPMVLAGHSLGATTALLVAAERPDLARALVLIDPVIFQPSFYAAVRTPGAVALARRFFSLSKQARRRRARFPSREEAFAALKGRGIFKTVPDEALRDYVEDGFLEDGEGGVRLACAPAFEANTFAAQRADPWPALRRLALAPLILRAETRSTVPAESWSRLAKLRPDARLAQIEGTTHALPWERPDRARAAIEAAALKAKTPGLADPV